MNPTELIRKHITTGEPAGIDGEAYFVLRNVVADEFELHPSAVVLVGSSRMGFSIVPKKRYRKVRAHSDLDLALISSERFDRYWDDVFAYSLVAPAWKHSPEYQQFVKMLFAGWIDPRGLPSVPRFERTVQWTDFFDRLMRSRQFGRRRITARLYRTWSRLEAYQEKAVRQCMATQGE